MRIGFIGLGKMGYPMVERLLQHGHEVVVYNRTLDKVNELAAKGAIPSTNLSELVKQLPGVKVIWMMVPSGKPIDLTIQSLLPELKEQDILIDGGNSYWKDSQRRNEELIKHNIHFIDCGTSGGVWGLKNGYCLMVGGKEEVCEYLEPIFNALAPENGYLYCGGSGAGHFVKMVHNGIEYGLMQAYAEGFELMKKSNLNLNLPAIAELWQHGSVVRSWLLELTQHALAREYEFSKIADYVEDSGEGRWTIQTAIEENVPVHVISAALFTRFQSRQEESFAMKLLAALRQQFGGHSTKSK